MFGFFKRKPAPQLCPTNPGSGSKAKVAFANGERTWVEQFDVAELAAAALAAQKHAFINHKTWLEHAASGFLLTPQFLELQPLDGGGVRTVTTMQINHPKLVPAGLFEYQHSSGQTSMESIQNGFDQWAQTDFVALLESARHEPEVCMTLEMEFPARADKPARVRRAILGPVAHYVQQPPPETSGDEAKEEHPFCPCCLLTRSFEAFKDLFDADRFYGLRLFAAREPDGSPQADCRVNGDDHESGAAALRAYAATWPAAGYEFRKQYVILQNLPPA